MMTFNSKNQPEAEPVEANGHPANYHLHSFQQ